MKYFKFNGLLQESGWISPAYVGIDLEGKVTYISKEQPVDAIAVEFVRGFVLPGFQNAHSHAFQFAMAGMAETHQTGSNDDFWSWREAMYACALSMNPEQLENVAAMLYAEMLRRGYTHVAEFHYLHHDERGKPYENLAEMGERLVSAANTAGIKITLIPIFYQRGNFGNDPLPRQRRFISKTIDDYFQLLDDSANAILKYTHARLGFGVHSLRAVEHEDVIKTFREGPPSIPFHLHAAEQLKEVDDCLAFLHKRPVEWLLENLSLNERFHIVHCTHMNDYEVAGLAKSNANVVLCPGTEGNLGDGIFRLGEFASHGGNWSLGTDSHISLNPLEDLRWLDYTQRVTTHKRNTFDNGAKILLTKTLSSGRMAMASGNKQIDFFEVDSPFDAVVYDADSPLLSRPDIEQVLPSLIYTADASNVLGTIVNGKWVVKNNVHQNLNQIKFIFQRTMKSLQA